MEKFALRYRFPPGQVLFYHNQTQIIQDTISAGALTSHNEAAWTSRTRLLVLPVADQEIAHLLVIQEPAVPQEGENLLKISPAREVAYLQLNSRGERLELAGSNPQLFFPLPESEVAAEEGWSGCEQFYAGSCNQPLQYQMSLHLSGLESTPQGTVYRIKFYVPQTSFSIPLAWPETRLEQMLDMQGELLFDPKLGAIKSTQVVTHTLAKLKNMALDTTISFSRQLEEVNS